MNENKNKVVVEYNHGCAEVTIGSRSLTIGQRDQDLPEYFCPVELVSAALGS
jgi:hypothetical protein